MTDCFINESIELLDGSENGPPIPTLTPDERFRVVRCILDHASVEDKRRSTELDARERDLTVDVNDEVRRFYRKFDEYRR